MLINVLTIHVDVWVCLLLCFVVALFWLMCCLLLLVIVVLLGAGVTILCWC